MSKHDEEHEEREKERGFRVVDKRRFNAEGETRPDAPPDATPKAPEQSHVSTPAPAASPGPTKTTQEPAAKPAYDIDFISFCASLATNALAAMGALPDAQARGLPKSPDLAREYIDILAMLEDKTRGNLSPQEQQALSQLLSELRLQFVELTRRR